jgi:hypothetical protein
MRAHSSGSVMSFVTMRVRWCKILRLTRQIVRSYSEYHPRVRHIHVNLEHIDQLERYWDNKGQWSVPSSQEHNNSEYILLINCIQLTLVDFQFDAQNSYLFTYNIFIKILYMFRALPCSSSGGLRRNCIYAASGIVTVCRWLSCAPVKKEFCASIWKSTKVILRYGQPIIKICIQLFIVNSLQSKKKNNVIYGDHMSPPVLD